MSRITDMALNELKWRYRMNRQFMDAFFYFARALQCQNYKEVKALLKKFIGWLGKTSTNPFDGLDICLRRAKAGLKMPWEEQNE